MLKMHVVESVHYNYSKETALLERQPYKVYSIRVSSTDCAGSIGQAIDDFVRDLVDVRSKLTTTRD